MLSLHIIIKYIILIGLIYLILRNIPSIEIYKKDIILIIIILVIILFIFDYIMNYNKEYIKPNNNYSNIICENMETTSPATSKPSETSPPATSPPNTTTPRPTKISIGDPSNPGNMKTSTNSDYDEYYKALMEEQTKILLSYNTILQNNVNNLLNTKSPSNITSLSTITAPSNITSPSNIPGSPNINNNCEIAINNLTKQFNSKLTELQMKLDLVNNQSNPTILLNYYNDLVSQLLNKGIITNDDITNIKIKVQNKLLTINDVIKGLEKLNNSAISKNTNYNMPVNIPQDFYTPIGDDISNDWSKSYTILDSSKWMVPMPRPPVCINNTPCKVCPIDDTSYPVSLQSWDNSRNITQDNTS